MSAREGSTNLLRVKAAPWRAGITPIISTVLLMGLTIVAAGVAWGSVNTQAGSSQLAYANGVASAINSLNEQFNIIDMYFGSSTSTTFWIFNTGSVYINIFQVRLYDSAGLVNILYNYTVSGSVKTAYLYDLKSTLATKCKTAASSYESPAITTVSLGLSNGQSLQLTIPPTQSNCPSFGQTFTTGTTYTVVVTGLYGKTVTYFAVK